MAYFAQVDGATGEVLQVSVCDTAAWLESTLGGTWIETSISHETEAYAGVGGYYSSTSATKFLPSWVGTDDQASISSFQTGEWLTAITDSNGNVSSGTDMNGAYSPLPSEGGTPTIRFERTYLPFYGQSLSVGGSGFPALSTENSAVDEMWVRGMRPEDDYHTETATEWYASVVPAKESISPRYATQGETPARGFADALRELVSTQYGVQSNLKFHLAAPGQGGIEIIKLLKGNVSGYYARIPAQITALVALKSGIETVGMEILPWIHGERDYLLATTGADYKARLVTLCADIAADAISGFGQANTVQVLGTQVASHIGNNNQVNAQIALAQAEAHDDIANFHMVCPMYQMPFKGADVHVTALGYVWVGAYIAAAYKAIITDGGTWSPLRPLSYSTTGSVCEITYDLPTVYGLSNELVFDTTQVPAQTNYGFRLFNAGGTPQTISSVTISQGNKVVITAASTITAGSYIDYARQGDATKGQGNLRDRAGDVLRGQTRYFNLPLHNWALISLSGAIA